MRSLFSTMKGLKRAMTSSFLKASPLASCCRIFVIKVSTRFTGRISAQNQLRNEVPQQRTLSDAAGLGDIDGRTDEA